MAVEIAQCTEFKTRMSESLTVCWSQAVPWYFIEAIVVSCFALGHLSCALLLNMQAHLGVLWLLVQVVTMSCALQQSLLALTEVVLRPASSRCAVALYAARGGGTEVALHLGLGVRLQVEHRAPHVPE